MFKKGQVIRGVSSGWVYLVLGGEGSKRSFEAVVLSVPDGKSCAGRKVLIRRNREYLLIGNNYQETSPAPLLEAEEEAVPMPRETHNLIQNLRRDNKELRRQNKDLRDDIGDMASKLHLANKRTLEVMTPHAKDFPGTAFKRWLSDLPEQRGCRKEDC